MNPEEFYQERQSNWAHLSALLDKSQKGIRTLTPDDVRLLGQLYRATTSDLALAQRDFPNHRVTAFLNQLVGRSHAVIYRSEPLAINRLKRFVLSGFPIAYRHALPYVLAAAILFVLPAVVVGFALNAQPGIAQLLLPREAQRLIPDIEKQELWTDIPIEERPYASSFIMTNNIQISFLAFAGGVTAGLLSIYVLILNGLLLGGITGLTAHYGVGLELWTFVIGHGVIELSTILIAGGSGLMIGWAIIHPGLMRRRDALAQAAQRAVQLIFGSVPLLVIAGLIEGFISPSESIPGPVKWGIGIGSGLLLYGYLLMAGRKFDNMPEDA